MKKFSTTRRRTGNEASVFCPPLGQAKLESPKHCRQQQHSNIHYYWGDKVTSWYWKRTEGPLKTASRCRFHILSFFFHFIFYQFNYSVNLINRYDYIACNLSARHLICSGSGRRGGFSGYCFSSFMMAGALDQPLPTSLFYHRGGYEESLCCLFFTLLPHFSVAEADLFKSCSSLVGSTCREKLTCGYVRPFLKCHCCMCHTRSSINKEGFTT